MRLRRDMPLAIINEPIEENKGGGLAAGWSGTYGSKRGPRGRQRDLLCQKQPALLPRPPPLPSACCPVPTTRQRRHSTVAEGASASAPPNAGLRRLKGEGRQGGVRLAGREGRRGGGSGQGQGESRGGGGEGLQERGRGRAELGGGTCFQTRWTQRTRRMVPGRCCWRRRSDLAIFHAPPPRRCAN